MIKILVVDDELDLESLIMQKFRNRIRNNELLFEFVGNGLKALEKLAMDSGIDLILSDINMPQMDGLTLLDKIKEKEYSQKTVMISAYGDMNNIRIAMNRGAFDFVIKPIDFSDFEITINKAIVESIKLKEANQTKMYLEKERKEKEALILNQNKILEQKVEERTQQLKIEKKKSDDLLLNILPEEVANELKQKGYASVKTYGMVTVLFIDFKDFTKISERITPELLVAELDYCFKAFDDIIEKNGIEKIKTIGDAYLCAAGLPVPSYNHAETGVKAAIEITEFMQQRKKEKEERHEIPFEARIGIHTGPVVAGVVGAKKFSYDIWGDTVNTAARMEQNSEAGKINISETTYKLLNNNFSCCHRGKIEAKNKGMIDMYFVE
jgi:class 3 adenylate cyclase/DNA-binding NarL/FixJ family response regulator